MERYDPATYRGGVLQLHYARAQELQPMAGSGGSVRQGSGAVLV